MSPRTQVRVFVPFLIAMAALIWWVNRERMPEVDHSYDQAGEAARKTRPRGKPAKQPVKPARPGARPESRKDSPPPPADSLAASAPRSDLLRQEVAENPHRTPPSLLLFSKQVAVRMEGAEREPKRAERVFLELSDCVLQEGAAGTARALCLDNASRLSGARPELKSRYSELRARAPESVARLALAIDFAEK